MQLTVVEHAFRVLQSELLLRPVGPHSSGRTQVHVMVGVLAYALWKTLDHRSEQAGLETKIHLPIGDILLETTDGRKLALRWVRPPRATASNQGFFIR